MNSSKRIKKMTGIACLSAVIVVLQIISNYITFGPVSITLALIPIVIGAILYGPKAGAFLGVVNGVVVLTAPSTLAIFMPINAFATVFTCLFKTGMAGLVSGLIFKLLEKKNMVVGTILASIIVPIINTLLYCLCVICLFPSLTQQDGMNFIIGIVVSTNFILEFALNSALSPTILYIIKIINKKRK